MGADIRNDPSDHRHGTRNGYGNLRCRCERCKKANAIGVREDNKKRRQQPIPEHVHGTANGYGNYGCRCRPCTDVWSADSVARARLRAAQRKEQSG